jgi:hypothetical protein
LKLVLDTSWLTFAVGSEPELVIDFETKQPKADGQGQPIYAVQLIASYRDDRSGKQKSEIVSVKLAGALPEVPIGTPVRVVDLVAVPWATSERNGVAYRAAGIEPLAKPTARAS